MQDLPDRSSLLTAVARFLADDRLKAAVRDPALAFRLKIAAHLIESVVREEKSEEAHDAAELSRLEALFALPRSAPELATSLRRARIAELNRRLATELRAGGTEDFAARAHDHLKATLADKLSVTTPRFDISAEVER